MLKRGIFVSGTDTGIGKTVVSSLLLSAARKTLTAQYSGYWKPLQTGSDSDSQTVAHLCDLSFDTLPKPAYSLPEPLSPAAASQVAGIPIEWDHLLSSWKALPDGFWILEGAGGLLVPISNDLTFRDLVVALSLPMLLVASTRVGTLNHTFLSIEAAQKAHIPILGIVLVGGSAPAHTQRLMQAFAKIPILAEIPTWTPLNSKQIQKNSEPFFGSFLKSWVLSDTSYPTQTSPQGAAGHPQSCSKTPDWLQYDTEHLWHPFSMQGNQKPLLPVLSGRNSSLTLTDGRVLLDGISSWWVNLHGHSHPEIAQAIQKQAAQLEHVIFAGCTHAPGVSLVQKILEFPAIAKARLTRAFYSDNGSTAVEVALKMAYQYHLNRGDGGRKRFIALKKGYHGDTLGAMAMGGDSEFHQPFRRLMPPVDFVEPGDLATLQQLLISSPGAHCAFIFEPYVQAAAGMQMYDRSYLDAAVSLCQSHGILAISDEVFTGFYRTGKCFALEYGHFQPDLVCLSKGITGGFLPLGLTLIGEHVHEAFVSEKMQNAFLHGHSYTANPLACAAGLASWELLQSKDCQKRIQALSQRTQRWVQSFENHPGVASTRYLGTIGAVQLQKNWTYHDAPKELGALALEQGVLLRPLGNVIYTVPPYCTTDLELDRIYEVVQYLVRWAWEKNSS